ncbi:MAG: hypothetical protein KDA24_04710 [Deltaproteobacteria bacterium]|nr:hypothetical protein [Deltaproteobacteria bacterium]
MMRHLLMVGSLALFGLAGCTSEPEPVAPVGPSMNDPQAVDLAKEGEGELTGAPPAAEGEFALRRRMDIDQLEASFTVATGLVWEDSAGRSQFGELSSTLGKPDYIDSTQEDLTVSLLFQKFLGDAARDVCERRSEGEANGSLEPLLMSHVEPTMTTESHPAEVDANLRELLLRFHGQDIDPASERMNPWRWLFTSTEHVTNDPVVAWRAVCIGLITHPDFYSY